MKQVLMVLLLLCGFSQVAKAQSCNNNLGCSAGKICDKSTHMCVGAPGQNGGGGGGGPSGPFSEGVHVSTKEVLTGWYGCFKGLYKGSSCEMPDQTTLQALMKSAVDSCMKSLKNASNQSTIQGEFDKCVQEAFSDALNNLLHQAVGCLPVINQVKSCINASVMTGGKAFNELWCQTYPQHPFCTGGKSIKEQVNVVLSGCVESTSGSKPSNSQCFDCCMKAFDCRNYRNSMIGETKKALCQSVEQSCNKCNQR